MPDTPLKCEDYVDPLASDAEGEDFDRHWLAEVAKVEIRDTDIGCASSSRSGTNRLIGRTLSQAQDEPRTSGILAVALIAILSHCPVGLRDSRARRPHRARTKLAGLPAGPARSRSAGGTRCRVDCRCVFTTALTSPLPPWPI